MIYQARKKRASSKEWHISKALCRQIVDGELPPGTQLPKRVELERTFSVSPVTLQRALQQLMDDGFIYAKAGLGTFVAKNPPHLSRYGLAFPTHPNIRETWTSFYTALNNAALDMQRKNPGAITIYYGLERPEHQADRDRLIQDIQTHRLAGLAFTFSPKNFQGTPILDEPRLPRVAIMREPAFGMPAVMLDGMSFASKGVEYLAERGRKKMAIIVAATPATQGIITSINRSAAALGISVQPYWTHAVHIGAADWARNVVHLMTMLPKDKQPDCMFITDDNLVPHATAGLLAGGISVPGDMDVVGHGNFPWLTPSVVSAKRIGFDARSVLALCLENVDKQRKRIACDAVTIVPARLDVEMEPVMV